MKKIKVSEYATKTGLTKSKIYRMIANNELVHERLDTGTVLIEVNDLIGNTDENRIDYYLQQISRIGEQFTHEQSLLDNLSSLYIALVNDEKPHERITKILPFSEFIQMPLNQIEVLLNFIKPTLEQRVHFTNLTRQYPNLKDELNTSYTVECYSVEDLIHHLAKTYPDIDDDFVEAFGYAVNYLTGLTDYHITTELFDFEIEQLLNTLNHLDIYEQVNPDSQWLEHLNTLNKHYTLLEDLAQYSKIDTYINQLIHNQPITFTYASIVSTCQALEDLYRLEAFFGQPANEELRYVVDIQQLSHLQDSTLVRRIEDTLSQIDELSYRLNVNVTNNQFSIVTKILKLYQRLVFCKQLIETPLFVHLDQEVNVWETSASTLKLLLKRLEKLTQQKAFDQLPLSEINILIQQYAHDDEVKTHADTLSYALRSEPIYNAVLSVILSN